MKLNNNLKCLALAGVLLSNFYSTAVLAEEILPQCSTAPLSHTEDYRVCICKEVGGKKIKMYTTEEDCSKCNSPKPEFNYSDCKPVKTK